MGKECFIGSEQGYFDLMTYDTSNLIWKIIISNGNKRAIRA